MTANAAPQNHHGKQKPIDLAAIWYEIEHDADLLSWFISRLAPTRQQEPQTPMSPSLTMMTINNQVIGNRAVNTEQWQELTKPFLHHRQTLDSFQLNLKLLYNYFTQLTDAFVCVTHACQISELTNIRLTHLHWLHKN